MGASNDYETARAAFYGEGEGPSPAPQAPSRSQDVLAEFERRLAASQLNSQHPRNFGYFTPPPLLMSIAGEVLAQMTNQGVDVWHAGPTGAFVEEEVVRWLAELVGYGPDSFGLLTSGGVMANFMAMALARDIHLPNALRAGPPASRPRPRGGPGLRLGPGAFLDCAGARRAGVPAGHAGRDRGRRAFPAPRRRPSRRRSPATGLPGSRRSRSRRWQGPRTPARWTLSPELADVAEREGLWLHVDAAYGGAARLSAKLAGRVPDLHRAHSVTVDPHKWFFQAYDIGGLLVRDGSHLGQTFGGRRPEYYRDAEGQVAGHDDHDEDAGQLSFYKLGFEGTRRWRALKLWLSWKHLGSEGLARLVETTVDLAAHLSRRCAEADDFEALPEDAELSVVCFRHLPGGRSAALQMPAGELDAHQDRLQAALEASGDGWLTTTRLARSHVPARGDRELPRDRGRHRPPARYPAAPRALGRRRRGRR